MAKNENLKNKIREEHLDLPNDLSWENMQSGIFDKINRKEATLVNQTKSNLKLTTWALMLFVLVFSVVTTYYITSQKFNQINDQTVVDTASKNTANAGQFKNNQDKLTNEQKQLKTPSFGKSSEKSNNPLQESQLTLEDSSDTRTSIKVSSDNKDDITLESKPSYNNITNNVKKFSSDNSTSTRSTTPLMETTNIPTSSSSIHKEERPNNLKISQTAVTEASAVIKKEERPPSNTITIETIDLLNPKINYQRSVSSIIDLTALNTAPIDISDKRSSNNRLSLAFTTGINQWSSQKIANPINEMLAQYESNSIGQTYGVGIGYELNEKWSLSAGLNYNRLRQALNFECSFDTLVQGTQLHVTINPITGERQEERVSAFVSGEAHRTVVHYNNLKYFSIPLSINRHFNLTRNISWRLGIGINYNLAADFKGRSLLAADLSEAAITVRDFDTSSANDNSIMGNWAYNASIGADIKLNQQLSLGLELNTSKQLQSWTLNGASEMRPMVYSGLLRLGFRI